MAVKLSRTTSSSPVAVPTNRSERRVLDALWGFELISRAWMRSSCIISALGSAQGPVFVLELSALLLCLSQVSELHL